MKLSFQIGSHASVGPAQRIPVHVHIDHVEDGVWLVDGETATVEIKPKPVLIQRQPNR